MSFNQSTLISTAYILAARYLSKEDARDLIAKTILNAICDADDKDLDIAVILECELNELIKFLEGSNYQKVS